MFPDSRGCFMEIYHQEKYSKMDIHSIFVQDNLSYSVRGTLRGLHFQHPKAQAKLVQVIAGEVFDVVVDIRLGGPTFVKWTSVLLSGTNKRQLYIPIPEGLAHGFCVLSDTALFMYECSDFYAPHAESGILWCDPDIGIDWPVKNPLLSGKDSKYPFLKDVPFDRLPTYTEPINDLIR